MIAQLCLIPLLFLLAGPAMAQFELQVIEPAGSRVAPAVYDLGPCYLKEALSARFRLRNISSATATVSTLSVAGAGFSLSAPAMPILVDPQVSFEFVVNFGCPALGSYSAVLRAGSTSLLLTATVQPSLTYRVEDTPLGTLVDYGSTQRGTSVRRRFTVMNQMPLLLTVPAISISGADFAFTGRPPSGAILSPQQSQDFSVEFNAAIAGPHLAILTLGDRNIMLTATVEEPPLPRPTLEVDLQPIASAQQGALIVSFEKPASSTAAGTATLDFRGSADPTVTFMNGGRTAPFAIAAGDTRVTLPFQTGTTAGTLVFSVLLGDFADTVSLQIPTAPPVLTQVQGSRTAGGIEVRITGWDNTHSASQIVFTFYDAAGSAIAPGAIRLNGSSEFSRFYATSDVGGSFGLRAVFPVTGDALLVSSVEVSLSDLVGTVKSARTPIQ